MPDSASRQSAEIAAFDTERLLVRRAKKGDVDAFSSLVEQYQRVLTAKALRSTRNVADADDMVQETFLRAFRNLTTFRDEERFGPWLHRILGNLLIDRSRKAWREIPEDEQMMHDLSDDHAGPEQELMARELTDAVQQALEQLPSGRQREVFAMRFVEGMPIRDIAERLGVHSGTIKTHLHRTTIRLRELLRSLEAAP